MALAIPVVNMNGNSKESMVEPLIQAAEHIAAAIKCLRQSDITHGRNYQTAIPGLYQEARQQQEDRITKLVSVADEVSNIALGIDSQGL